MTIADLKKQIDDLLAKGVHPLTDVCVDVHGTDFRDLNLRIDGIVYDGRRMVMGAKSRASMYDLLPPNDDHE